MVKTHEKGGHQSKEQGQTAIWRYTLEMKALMLMSQATHKQTPTTAQVSKTNGVQQVQHKEQYVWLQLIVEYQLH